MKAYQSPDGIRFESDAYVPCSDETLLPDLPEWDHATERLAEWDGKAWQVVPLNPDQLSAKQAEAAMLARRTWANSAEFLAEFTMEERGRIANADNDQVQGFALTLATWVGPIHADAPQVIGAMNLLAWLGLLPQDRADAILK